MFLSLIQPHHCPLHSVGSALVRGVVTIVLAPLEPLWRVLALSRLPSLILSRVLQHRRHFTDTVSEQRVYDVFSVLRS